MLQEIKTITAFHPVFSPQGSTFFYEIIFIRGYGFGWGLEALGLAPQFNRGSARLVVFPPQESTHISGV